MTVNGKPIDRQLLLEKQKEVLLRIKKGYGYLEANKDDKEKEKKAFAHFDKVILPMALKVGIPEYLAVSLLIFGGGILKEQPKGTPNVSESEPNSKPSAPEVEHNQKQLL